MVELRLIDVGGCLAQAARVGTALLVAGWLTGCGYPGTSKLKELCELEGFPKVYREVSAAGYYDDVRECDDLINHMENWEFSFVECRQGSSAYRNLIPEGTYRISKVNETSGRCDSKLLEDIQRRQFGFEKMISNGLCFTLTRIDKPKAAYGFYQVITEPTIIDNLFGSRINSLHLLIKDRRQDEIVVDGKSFMLLPHPGLTISSFDKMLSCRTIDERFEEVKGLTAVNHYINPIPPGKEINHANIGRDLPGGAAR